MEEYFRNDTRGLRNTVDPMTARFRKYEEQAVKSKEYAHRR